VLFRLPPAPHPFAQLLAVHEALAALNAAVGAIGDAAKAYDERYQVSVTVVSKISLAREVAVQTVADAQTRVAEAAAQTKDSIVTRATDAATQAAEVCHE
jgi:hypothetical protein